MHTACNHIVIKFQHELLGASWNALTIIWLFDVISACMCHSVMYSTLVKITRHSEKGLIVEIAPNQNCLQLLILLWWKCSITNGDNKHRIISLSHYNSLIQSIQGGFISTQRWTGCVWLISSFSCADWHYGTQYLSAPVFFSFSLTQSCCISPLASHSFCLFGL